MAMTLVRVLETNEQFRYDQDLGARGNDFDSASRRAAERAFESHRARGGSAVARVGTDAPFKNITAIPENATEVILLPRVAGG